jgi:hypothetical protein
MRVPWRRIEANDPFAPASLPLAANEVPPFAATAARAGQAI